MDVSGAVQWWEEWQLRILVLGSLVIQYILLVASCARKFPIRSWFRPVIWLAYLGSDAVAIYALATLFNRHSKPQQEDGDGGSSILEVLWAPILLIHLGGQDSITAYNIEDNELWTRHILTSVSQVTVAVYVFCKSWSGDDKRLLQAAILLFICGTLKCIEKPLALNRASINSLVSSGEPVQRSINTQKLKIDPLEDFIDKATSSAEDNSYLLTPAMPVDFTPYKLFVDHASPSADDRIRILLTFSALDDIDAYCKMQHWLSQTFQLLYTKEKTIPSILRHVVFSRDTNIREMKSSTGDTPFDQAVEVQVFFGTCLRGLSMYLLFPAVALFHHSHREAYSEYDVKVTYAVLCCTAAMEFFGMCLKEMTMCLKEMTRVILSPELPAARLENGDMVSQCNPVEHHVSMEHYNMIRLRFLFDDMVSQYNLIGLFIRNRKYSKMMKVVGVLGCTNSLQQRWCMKSCSSSLSITKLVLKYVKGGWEHHIRDVSSYRKFNDNRGQFTVERQGCYQELGWSLEGAFDESVLLWHLATDFCYHDIGASRSYHGSWCTQDSCPHVYACPAWCKRSDYHEGAVWCREMSNYMMYLLFVNPEMLMAGTRRNLFTAAYEELEGIDIKIDKPPVEEREVTPAMRRERRRNKVLSGLQKETQLTQRIIGVLDSGGSPPADGTQQKKGIIHDAWTIAKVLCGLPEEKMWTVIEGVWVEMMCFSAARCRGYLHAKGLATGVEYLTYVWLLQYYMGMETLADKLQRADHHHHHHRNGGENGDGPSTSRVRREATGQEQAAGPSRSSGGATDEERAAGQSSTHQGTDATGEEMV
ncbi:uncharacterized protein LOC119320067 [Triticum dicoccoides]|uniref:uncharacterized protein LOC119320067 n=1 Tax=Triticum dicoccoides TaxID=85692 RepID=UPI001890D17B|nr:uncharacterized protein LOC119320067 [Triticum dicoccoides]